MNQFIDWLFQLERVSSGGEGVELRFAHPLPLWAWVFISLGCLLLAAWSYWKLIGNRSARSTFAVIRTILLLLIAVIIAGPQLVKQNDQIERDWVVVMADRSASLTVADAPGQNGRITREDQLLATIRAGWPAFAKLAQDRNVLFLGFDSGVFDLRTTTAEDGQITGLHLGPAAGRRTMLAQALEQTLRRVAARPVAGIVILSDGRSSDTLGRAPLKQLEARQIPVFTVPLGSAQPLTDMALTRLDAPSAAFVGDMVPISVNVEHLGGSPETPVTGRVQLIDDATGAVLDETPLERAEPGAGQNVTLTANPEEPGQASWTVRLVLDTPDLTVENNRLPVRIELVDRPIRVVYFDGYPRWEYRYLKNLLLRERSIRSSTLLLASDRRYIQEGSDVLESIPRSQEAWNDIDVILMGDLRPGLFSNEQLQQIRHLVAERGAGLLWIGGSAATPGAWRGTPLADLLPFALASAEGARSHQEWLDAVVLRPGPAASRYGVLQMGDSPREPWPDALSDPSLGWNTFRWAQRIEPSALKPTTEVLALASPASTAGGSSSSPTPLVMTMRYGAGRVVYVATDETWRYRYARGEVLTERFWVPVIRLLARESLARSGKPAVIEASPELAQVNQQVQVTVRLIDQTLVDRRAENLRVRVVPQNQPGTSARATSPQEITLKPDARAEGGPADHFVATWVPTEPGVYRVEPSDQLLTGLDLSTTLEVLLPDDELRIPQTDHQSLAAISQATGGMVLDAAGLKNLPDLLPNRELHLLGTPDVETLWDKPVIWTVLMLLLVLEWVGRRLIKLS